jgi:acetyl-CoA carboxylase carboxyltransferase component
MGERPSGAAAQSELLRRLRAHAHDGPAGGTERQHGKGKLTARERIDLLVDEGTFTEIGTLVEHRATGLGLEHRHPPSDGVVTGWGTVDGRVVFVFAHDFRIFGGALGEMFAAKIVKLMDMAAVAGAPVIGLNDGGGARIQEGVAALDGFAQIFRRNVRLSGVVPQLSVILGPCAGGAVYSPALTDFIVMVEGIANMYITGPDVIAAVTGEQVTHEDLGGARAHGTKSGVATFVSSDEEDALWLVRELLSFLPSNNNEVPPNVAPTDDPDRACPGLADLVPTEGNRAYDVRKVIAEIVDDGEMLEIQSGWAGNIVCCLARLDGHPIGIVANQPMVLAGAIDINASEKAARFVRTCDTFNIPLVSLVDVPGFLPGVGQEHSGIIRHGAKLLYAYCEATVPRISVILRKAYGGAYIVMESRGIGADLCFVWPGNEVAVMGAEAAVGVIFRRELADAGDPRQRRMDLVSEYRRQLMSPYAVARRGLVDDVIDPADTRRVLIRSLAMLRNKREQLVARKHGNEPF